MTKKEQANLLTLHQFVDAVLRDPKTKGLGQGYRDFLSGIAFPALIKKVKKAVDKPLENN